MLSCSVSINIVDIKHIETQWLANTADTNIGKIQLLFFLDLMLIIALQQFVQILCGVRRGGQTYYKISSLMHRSPRDF